MNLGPKWQDNEITAFFEAYKSTGGDPEKVKEHMEKLGFNRSTENIRSLITKVMSCTKKGAETLCAIMHDYYRSSDQPEPAAPSQPSRPMEEDLKEPSMLCNESLQIPKAFHFTTESSFTKNVGFYEPAKQLAMSMPLPPQAHQVGSIKIPTSRFNASPEAHQHIGRRVEHVPLLEPQKRLKRRMSPQIPQIEQPMSFRGLSTMDPYSVIFDEMAMLHNPEYGRSERYQQAVNIYDKVKKWVKYEYFYSGIDKPYFEKNELQECLTSLGIPYKRLRRADFILIRKAIGKPRRLSARFLQEERQKLQKYREIARELIPYLVFYRKSAKKRIES